MEYYCTLFNHFYLSRGLSLYESLTKHSKDFHLYIFAFDQETYDILIKLQLEKATVIALSDFEDEALLRVKSTRNVGEYCWTCTPSVIRYVLEQYNVPRVTYIDADCYFFGCPSSLLEEMGDMSILLTEHHYTPEYNSEAISGKYCVQFICFTNDQRGLQALNWWREQCLHWCYARVENGLFGDQKYLDDWTSRFEGVHVLKHKGGGVAPWNVQQYRLINENDGLKAIEKSTQTSFRIIFYHFHELRFIGQEKIDLGGYKLTNDVVRNIYQPYIQALLKAEKKCQQSDLNLHGIKNNRTSIMGLIYRKIKGSYNIYPLRSLN